MPLIEAPAPKPTIDPNRENQKQVTKYFKRKYEELFIKTFGEPDQNKSRFYQLYYRFIKNSNIQFTDGVNLKMAEENIRWLMTSDAWIAGKTERLQSKIVQNQGRLPKSYILNTSLRTRTYDPNDTILKDLEISFRATAPIAIKDASFLTNNPELQVEESIGICRIALNPNKPNEILVDCDPNSIIILSKDSYLDFRSNEDIPLRTRMSIEFIISALQKAFPHRNEAEILTKLHKVGKTMLKNQNKASHNFWIYKINDPVDINSIEELIEEIIRNPKQASSLSGFTFTKIPGEKYAQVSTLPKSQFKSNL